MFIAKLSAFAPLPLPGLVKEAVIPVRFPELLKTRRVKPSPEKVSPGLGFVKVTEKLLKIEATLGFPEEV